MNSDKSQSLDILSTVQEGYEMSSDVHDHAEDWHGADEYGCENTRASDVSLQIRSPMFWRRAGWKFSGQTFGRSQARFQFWNMDADLKNSKIRTAASAGPFRANHNNDTERSNP